MSTTTFTHSAAVAKARPGDSKRIWLGFLVVLAAAVMDLLDSTIAQTAAPAIRRDLGGSYADLEWISAAYTLAMAATLLLGSRLGDAIRPPPRAARRASAASSPRRCCARWRPSPSALIAARALQGAVAAIMVPQGFGLIRELFGDEGQQKAFAVFGPVMGLAAVAGPLLGGALVNLDLLGTGWRAIFLVNVPIGLAGDRGRPAVPARPGAHRPRARGSTLRASAGDGRRLRARLSADPGSRAGLAGVVVRAARPSAWSRSARSPRSRCAARARAARRWSSRRSCAAAPYVAGLAVVLGFIGAMGGMMIALNVMFQTGLGLQPRWPAASRRRDPGGGDRRLDHLLRAAGQDRPDDDAHRHRDDGARPVVVDLVMRSASGGVSAWELAGPLAITGFGMGMVFVPMFDVILAGVAPHELGSASGLLESVQQLAMSLGIAAVGTVLFDRLGGGHGPVAFVGAADHALLVAVGFLVAACTAVFWLPKHARASH